MSLIHLFHFLFYSISSIIIHCFSILLQILLDHFFSSSIIIITTFIIHWIDLIFWYSFTSSLLTSYGVYSLSIDFVYFSTCYKHWESFSILSRVKMFLIDLIHYLFRYFYFSLMNYFLLVSLPNRMINKVFSKLLIKSREYIPKVFPWCNLTFIIIREVICKIINITFTLDISYLL